MNKESRAARRGLVRLARTLLAGMMAMALSLGLLTATATPAHARTVTFPDTALARCVEDTLYADSRVFTTEELASIEQLWCGFEGVVDLSGIEWLTNVTEIDLSGNNIVDLRPMVDLDQLEVLDLAYNRIRDVSPLKGLSSLQKLDISGNHIGRLGPLASLPDLTALNASGQQIDLRIPIGVATELPFGSVDGDTSFEGYYSKKLKLKGWKITAKTAGSYEVNVIAVGVSYDFDIAFDVTAYKAKNLKAATPKIKGSARVGSTLTASMGTWKPQPTKVSYQWYRSGKKIKKATQPTYTLTKADKGKKITVKVTGRKDEYKATTKTSKATKVKAGLLKSVTPTITGTAQVGQPLTVHVEPWGPAKVTLSYQWYRSGKKIKKATKSTYTLTKADKGKKITVKVTGKKSGYTTKTVGSKPAVTVG